MKKENSRYERNIHAQFERYDRNHLQTTNHIESRDTFRAKFSIYSIPDDKIIHHGEDLWDHQNLGGVPVDYNRETKEVYVDSSESHTLLIGSTGSKKSRLVAMPLVRILATAGESMVISDPKAEIYRRTAGSLVEKGYKVHVVNFRNPELSDGWNFLYRPYQLYKNGQIDKACEMVNDAAINLIPIQSTKDLYWDYSARDLFVGLALLLFKICKDYNYPENAANIQNLLNLRTEMFQDSVGENIRGTNYWKLAETDSFIKNRLIGTVVLDTQRTLSCILSTFDQHLSCFSLSPKLTQMLTESTFTFDNMGYDKVALFMILPDEKTTYHKLAAILIKECYENLIEIAYKREANNRFPRRINFILDEFSSLPQIGDFPQMIAASRSRNIRFHLVMQSKKQLQQRYDNETETIQSNCGNWMFLYTKELDLLREINELGGKKGNNDLIPLHQLQHLNKEKGECLIFFNRLYPYYAFLPDISEYDNDDVKHMEFPKLKINAEFFDLICELKKDFEPKGNAALDNLDDLFEDGEKEDSNNDTLDIQKELEAKFDELFGSSDDSDNN